MPVGRLGDDRRPVSDQVGDLLNRHVVVDHDRDEGVLRFAANWDTLFHFGYFKAAQSSRHQPSDLASY